MLRLLRALTSRSPEPHRPDSRCRCARCGRSFAPADAAYPDLYCWWCVTHQAEPPREPYQPADGPE